MSLARRGAVLAAAIQQIVAPALIFAGGQFGGFSADQSLPTPAQPAGYAFAIWGPIYLGCLLYAIHQAMPRNADHPALRAVAWPTVALFVGSTLWLWLAKHGPLWATVQVIWAMLGLAVAVMLGLARPRAPLSRTTKLVAGWPLALYAGWLSAAAFVNTAAILPTYGTGTAGLGVDGLGLLMVGMAAMLALVILVASRGALPYALAVVWALVGIVIANRATSTTMVWTATGAAVLLLVVLLAIRRRRRTARTGPLATA